MSTDAQELELPTPHTGIMEVRIVGKTPYMRNPWTETGKRSLIDGESPDKLSLEEEYEEKLAAMQLPSENGGEPQYGMPPQAFQEGMARAAKSVVGGYKLVDIKNGISIPAEGEEIPFESPGPEMDVQPTNLAGRGSVKLTARPKFMPWSATIPIAWNESSLKQKEVLQFLMAMGLHVGIGAYRPENSGPFGTFGVEGAWLVQDAQEAHDG